MIGEKVAPAVSKGHLAIVNSHGERCRLIDGGCTLFRLAHLHLFGRGDDHERFLLDVLSVVLYNAHGARCVEFHSLCVSRECSREEWKD